MNRPTCREDLFEFRVKAILTTLKRAWVLDGKPMLPFSQWIERNREMVGTEFLNDVDSYMGMPDVEDI